MTGTAWVSPLAEIERAAQQRAKDVDLDLGSSDGAAKLRGLIADEIDHWQDEHRRGKRPVAIVDPDGLCERAMRNLAGYGPLEPLLSDDDVWEVMVNGPDAIFVKRHHGPSGYHDEVFHDDDHVVRTLTKLLDDASQSHRKLDASEGLQDAQLDDGARLHIVHRDIGRDGHLLVNIRKFTGVPYRSLDELVVRGTLTQPVAGFLRACVRAGLSIVVAGAPGSGKTTLLSCCAAELDPALRVVIAEEVFEADVPLPNVAHMQTRPARPERGEVDLRRLVAGFLRMAPDVAIVGEVRDRERPPHEGFTPRATNERCRLSREASYATDTSSNLNGKPDVSTEAAVAPLSVSRTSRSYTTPSMRSEGSQRLIWHAGHGFPPRAGLLATLPRPWHSSHTRHAVTVARTSRRSSTRRIS
jgi:pilus assembly protein CpaF